MKHKLQLIRHCEPTGRRKAQPDDRLSEAIQSREQEMDCFVAEFIIGPAEGRTRWLLAMTLEATHPFVTSPASASLASSETGSRR